MEGAVKALASEFQTVRTGRASTGLLDRVTVEAYGTRTPLNQLATINAPEPRLLTVQPYDRSIMASVEKAIMESDLGLTPNNDGQIIRLPVPQLTEERRKEMVRLVHKMAEEARVAVRNVRRDVLNELKRAEKDGDLSRDELSRGQDEVQKLTDAEVKAIDDLMARKEAEILEV
jgi:ribosome recycling factor